MGSREVHVIFDNPLATYDSGDTVSGSVNLRVDHHTRVKDLSLIIVGEALVQYPDDDTPYHSPSGKQKTLGDHVHVSRHHIFKKDENSAHVPVHTSNHGHGATYQRKCGTPENYFRQQYRLIYDPSGDDVEVTPGDHTFRFSVNLPTNIPCSFEGIYGFVRYTVKVMLTRPWKFTDEYKFPFTVISHLDLNTVEEALLPITVEEEKEVGKLMFKSGSIKGTLQLPESGFVCGQYIPVNIDVVSNCDKEIKEVTCCLTKKTKFTNKTGSFSHDNYDRRTMVEVKLGRVPPYGKKKLTEYIMIPPTPPTGLPHCNIIDVGYAIKLDLDMPGLHRSLKLKAPIIIGTKPLSRYPAPVQYITTSVRSEASAPSTQPPETPPPSYEECIFGAGSTIRDRLFQIAGLETFTPRYPSYKFPLPEGTVWTHSGFMQLRELSLKHKPKQEDRNK